MATGAGDQFWEQQRLPGVLKHDLLRRYLPVFAAKTASRASGVVYLDGYAGRGRYQDGSPASAERILQIAEQQATQGITYRLFFYERDSESFAALDAVVREYVARGVQVEAIDNEVVGGLGRVVDAARGKSLFLFLDPCGLGIPFLALVQTLSGSRAAKWPPTEVLLNFSLEAVRRIAGHVTSPTPNERTMARLDEALGGDWWRDLVRRGGLSDQVVDEIVTGFRKRLERATGMQTFAIPVRRAPWHKPIYVLVFGTRKPLGMWHFADDTARATETWWSTLDAQEFAQQEVTGRDTLFPLSVAMRPDLGQVEAQARPVVVENIARLVAARGPIRVGDFPAEVFGNYLGRVRETVVRAAIKDLHASGRTLSDGVGRRIPDLLVTPPR